MSVETSQDLNGLKAVGHAVGYTLHQMKNYARPGMSTLELDQYGAELLHAFGAVSAPHTDYGFPGCTCISVNEEACHGIPRADRILGEGDLINIDVSAVLDGYYADNGGSFILGEDLQGLEGLVQASADILQKAMVRIRGGVPIRKVGGYIEKLAARRGYRVIKNLCGHGIGRRLHEAPEEIPCFRDRYNRGVFISGSVIALETFIASRGKYVYQLSDGWALAAERGGFVAQHEHTLLVTNEAPVVFTASNGLPWG